MNNQTRGCLQDLLSVSLSTLLLRDPITSKYRISTRSFSATVSISITLGKLHVDFVCVFSCTFIGHNRPVKSPPDGRDGSRCIKEEEITQVLTRLDF